MTYRRLDNAGKHQGTCDANDGEDGATIATRVKTDTPKLSQKCKQVVVTAREVVGLARKVLKSNRKDTPTRQVLDGEPDTTNMDDRSESRASQTPSQQDPTGGRDKLSRDKQPVKQQNMSRRTKVGDTRGGDDAEEDKRDAGKHRVDNVVVASSTKRKAAENGNDSDSERSPAKKYLRSLKPTLGNVSKTPISGIHHDWLKKSQMQSTQSLANSKENIASGHSNTRSQPVNDYGGLQDEQDDDFVATTGSSPVTPLAIKRLATPKIPAPALQRTGAPTASAKQGVQI
ncbi:hypothetical protein PAXINDRAFT_154174 [Paxillus involutus ATCC 200175]|nr:hypothetical protein PAXINDRAFT_154174 [Paxillus involutus ATCC 200175]